MKDGPSRARNKLRGIQKSCGICSEPQIAWISDGRKKKSIIIAINLKGKLTVFDWLI